MRSLTRRIALTVAVCSAVLVMATPAFAVHAREGVVSNTPVGAAPALSVSQVQRAEEVPSFSTSRAMKHIKGARSDRSA